jgi:nucleotide-binding universal stress UspA family protein
MKTILVPLDGAALAEQALAYAQMLAPLLEAKIHLLRAISEPEREALLAGDMLEQPEPNPAPAVCAQCALTTVCAHTNCYIAVQAMRLSAAHIECDADMRVGTPAPIIAQIAQDASETLIVMATHGTRGLRRWIHGSVADKIVHDTAAPLLLIQRSNYEPSAVPKLQRILVPLDGSALAQQALPLAITLAAQAQAELILLWVVAPSIDAYLRAFPAESDARQALNEQMMDVLTATSSTLSAPAVQVTTAVGIGMPAQAIAEEAEWRRVDLIVMASHGYVGLQRWRQGSVADGVLHATTTPLLLVRSQTAPSERRPV